MIVAMLQHFFGPPPDHLAIPWALLVSLGAAAFGGCLLAAATTVFEIRRLPLGATLQEE